MRVVKKSADVLREGDRITVSVTHQIRIGGEDSWVKYEASSKLWQSEDAEDAAQRVIAHVNQGVMEAVVKTVKTVREHS